MNGKARSKSAGQPTAGASANSQAEPASERPPAPPEGAAAEAPGKKAAPVNEKDSEASKGEKPKKRPGRKPRPVAIGPGKHFTDLGNGERLAERHKDHLRYCHPWKSWLEYDGKRWKRDESGAAPLAATETIRSHFKNAGDAIRAIAEQIQQGVDEHTEARLKTELHWQQKLQAWCLASEQSARIDAMLKLAQSRPGIPIQPGDMDQNHFLLNLGNGTLDLKTLTLRPHDPNDLLTKLAPTDYDPAAAAPAFYDFLATTFQTHPALIGYLRQFLGLCLTGDITEQLLHIFHGVGANGKSTLIGTLFALLGDDYAGEAPSDLLIAKEGERHPVDRSTLFGKRLVVCSETEENRKLNVALVKNLTGGDVVVTRRERISGRYCPRTS
jgi:putative DNA primase/helicase